MARFGDFNDRKFATELSHIRSNIRTQLKRKGSERTVTTGCVYVTTRSTPKAMHVAGLKAAHVVKPKLGMCVLDAQDVY